MTCFEGKLYFLTDKYYSENALDWDNNTVRWVNLRTLETGDVPLEEENRSLSGFRNCRKITATICLGKSPAPFPPSRP